MKDNTLESLLDWKILWFYLFSWGQVWMYMEWHAWYYVLPPGMQCWRSQKIFSCSFSLWILSMPRRCRDLYFSLRWCHFFLPSVLLGTWWWVTILRPLSFSSEKNCQRISPKTSEEDFHFLCQVPLLLFCYLGQLLLWFRHEPRHLLA